MARRIDIHSLVEHGRINMNQDRFARLESFLTTEIIDAQAARTNLEHNWRLCLSDYEGVADFEYLNIPVEGFKKIVVTIGAIASDTIYAQSKDLLTSISPLVTVRGIPKRRDDTENRETTKALQDFISWGAANEWGTYDAMDDLVLDDVQLGTGVLYTSWQERRLKTRTANVLSFGPYTACYPPEDVFVPGGSQSNLHRIPWIAFRNWYTETEFNEISQTNNWIFAAKAMPASVSDWVKQRREAIGRQMEGVTIKGKRFDIMNVHARFDIDGDGIAEDLLIIWNQTAQKILGIGYAPYDDIPVDVARYQKRGHLFWGLGVMEMMRPYQEEMTDIHNWRNLNMYLANCRLWKAKYGAVPETLTIWGGKVVQMADTNDLEALPMADVYPSSWQAEMLTGQLAEKRVGVNEMSSPRPSNVMGSRTPGITAMTMMSQANKRFVPAYDGMRNAVSGSIRQCLYRYKEQLLAGNTDAMVHIIDVMGEERGSQIIRVLKDEKFEEATTLELTASSAIVNKEADRQNSMLLANILIQYYEKILQLSMMASNQQVPEQVRSVAGKIATGAYEIVERTIRTFDQVRDPSVFLVDMAEEFDKIDTGQQPNAMQGLMGMMGQAGGPEQGMPGQQAMLPPGGEG